MVLQLEQIPEGVTIHDGQDARDHGELHETGSVSFIKMKGTKNMSQY